MSWLHGIFTHEIPYVLQAEKHLERVMRSHKENMDVRQSLCPDQGAQPIYEPSWDAQTNLFLGMNMRIHTDMRFVADRRVVCVQKESAGMSCTTIVVGASAQSTSM